MLESKLILKAFFYHAKELELPLLSIEPKNDYSTFQVMVVWFQEFVKFCKLSSIFNFPKAIKDSSLTCKESFIQV
jgi:hypothetical protein